jgi:hypothetical protein
VQEREGRRGEFAEFGELQVDDVRVVFDQRREGFGRPVRLSLTLPLSESLSLSAPTDG